MALPIQTEPKYNCILPSDGKEVKYRPFLVKEQKMLLIAQEENDEAKIFEAVKDLIRSESLLVNGKFTSEFEKNFAN